MKSESVNKFSFSSMEGPFKVTRKEYSRWIEKVVSIPGYAVIYVEHAALLLSSIHYPPLFLKITAAVLCVLQYLFHADFRI